LFDTTGDEVNINPQPSSFHSDPAVDKDVLIVDDEENLLLLLDRVLRKEGYKVVTAQDSRAALDLQKEDNFKLAIIDIKMYPLDGVTLLSEIKKQAPSTEVIMITAYPTPSSRDECFARGASGYLTKPLDLQELKTVVRELSGT
jgi:DNA-binding response OmpR family regulator